MHKKLIISGIITDLESINDNLTVISLYSIDRGPNIIPNIQILFYKRLDDKYIGKAVDFIAKKSTKKGYIEETIESADDSEKITLLASLINEIKDNYERLGI